MARPSRLAAQRRAMDRAFGVDPLDTARCHAGGATPPATKAAPPRASTPATALPPRPISPLASAASPAERTIAPQPDAAPRTATRTRTADAVGIGGAGGRVELAGERGALLEALRERHARECPHCTTATAHTQLVFGEGASDARLVFVGEAPGETEDQTGRPFVGRAGQKLDEMIAAMKFRREQVYIANVLKSRPPNNRTPLQGEIDGCGPYLIEQLCILRPQVIVTLGGPATKLLLATDTGITRLRGQWGAWRAPEWTGLDLQIPVMPTYHPAYLLRNYTAQTRAEVWSDLQAVMTRLGV